jgi:hypothetical protein
MQSDTRRRLLADLIHDAAVEDLAHVGTELVRRLGELTRTDPLRAEAVIEAISTELASFRSALMLCDRLGRSTRGGAA